MIKPRIALFNFVEGRQREGVYQARRPTALREIARVQQILAPDVQFVPLPVAEIRGKSDITANIRAAESAGADAFVMNVPIFNTPALVAHAARQLTRPFALVGNAASDSLSPLALLASGGAVDQLGIRHRRIPGDLADEQNRLELLAYLRAAAAMVRLRGMTFGCIGGRALGISTGTADLVLWERIFGVDIEHIDQYELVRRAEKADAADVQRYAAWLEQHLGALSFNGTSFTPAHLDRQIRSYLATKSIIKDFELDFIGIKCQPELSNGYALQCLNVALVNDPYDADGPKEPVVCSCEADHDGGLTMQILKLLSGGQPTSLNDIITVTADSMTLANCGSMATHFAALSDNPATNLKAVRLVPHTFGDAGGAATQFVVPPMPLTLARLFRRGDHYNMGTLTGHSEQRPRDPDNRTLWPRPLLFPRVNADLPRLMRRFGSNHIHAVRGHFTRELHEFCQLLDIEYESFDATPR